MKYRIFSILTLVCFSWMAAAQQSKPIQFREEAFDFGTVKEEGGPVTHEFVFTNASNRPIKILNVQPSCGCTTPGWTKEPIAPGKTGYIQATYNPQGRPGFFNKTLTVVTDVDSNPVILQIKGTVSSEDVVGTHAEFTTAAGSWKLKTGSFNIGKVYLKDEATVRDFQFLNSGTQPVAYSKFVGPAYIKVDVTPKTIKPGDIGHIKIAYNGKLKNKYGFQSDNVELYTDDEAQPVKSFSVYATLEDYFPELKPEERAKAPQLRINASSVDYGRIATATTREVSFVNTGKKELLIKSLQGNCTCVSATASKTTLKPGDSAVFKITFDPAERKATQTKSLTVYSNDPVNPVQRITLSAYAGQ